jgi:multidrug efflux pump subunit AcrA (membrane-fusion protein)
MTGQTNYTRENSGGDTVDLSALGRTWTPADGANAAPEVEQILAGMPPFAARGLIYTVILSVVAISVWSALCSVNTVSEGRGSLIPEGEVRPVQAQQGGAVRYLLVRVGDSVESNQPLLQIDPAPQTGQLEHLRGKLAAGLEQFQRLSAEHRASPELLEVQQHILELENEVNAAEQSLKQCTLTAPVAGTVTTLNVRGPGAVVQAGEQIATIAPRDVPLVAEARLPNGKIARVLPGLPAQLKLDAYPWLQYGATTAVVTSVAPDAETDAAGESYYRVLLKPQRTASETGAAAYNLRPGLALTAEIITGRSTILRRLYDSLRGVDD